jgi:molecular chaperone DnaK
MKKEAQENEEADKTAKERIEKLNNADSLVFQTEKQLNEFGDKIPAEKKAPIEEALTKLKEAHKSEDIPAIDQAMEALNTAWQAASQDIYNAQQSASGGGTAGGPGDPTAGGASDGADQEKASKGGDDEVTDVDFEEVK